MNPSGTARALQIPTALARVEAQHPAPSSRLLLSIICALLATLVLWTLVAHLDVVAVAQGRLVPQSYIKVVQPASAGIVREILVHEGDRVTAGQALLRLDATTSTADREALHKEVQLHALQLRRIAAELAGTSFRTDPSDDRALFQQVNAQYESNKQSYAGRLAQEREAGERATNELAAAQAVLARYEATVPMYQKTAASYRNLATQGLVSLFQAEERDREAIEQARGLDAQRATVRALQAAARQATERASQVKSEYRNALTHLRIETTREAARATQQQAHALFESEHLELRASQDGVVKDMATTTIGSVVQPGAVLLTLVPVDEPLRAEVEVLNKDMGFVRKGQKVRVKLMPYAFQKYGVVNGTLLTISADSKSSSTESDTRAPDALASFKALVELERQWLGEEQAVLPLSAGMQVTAEIIQGRRTVAEYLLSPIQRIADESARER